MTDWNVQKTALAERLTAGRQHPLGKMVALADLPAFLEAVLRPGDRVWPKPEWRRWSSNGNKQTFVHGDCQRQPSTQNGDSPDHRFSPDHRLVPGKDIVMQPWLSHPPGHAVYDQPEQMKPLVSPMATITLAAEGDNWTCPFSSALR